MFGSGGGATDGQSPAANPKAQAPGAPEPCPEPVLGPKGPGGSPGRSEEEEAGLVRQRVLFNCPFPPYPHLPSTCPLTRDSNSGDDGDGDGSVKRTVVMMA